LLAGLVLCLVLSILALSANVLAPYDPVHVSTAEVLTPPSSTHWLGTDDVGRDVLSRILYGARTSLALAGSVVLLSSTLGVAVALASGYWGGPVDMFLMRVMDGLLAFPGLILALAMLAFIGANNLTIVLAITLVAIPGLARLTRSQVLVERRRDYVEAARLLGAPDLRILLRHILPNVAALVIVQASLNFAFAILTEASLSFLGVGVPPPAPTWGAMLRAGYAFLAQAPWVAVTPGAAIFVTVLAFNLLGDGLRRRLAPTRR
jgi:ABC-type dipeptide/oligopeptide/nickel transport system permease subunit